MNDLINHPASSPTSTRSLYPELCFSLDVDRYGQPASRHRRRLPGCQCSPPCLAYRCRAPGCDKADLVPWCLGCSDAHPNACDDCWARLTAGEAK
jgi:hypothetical protein